MLIVNADDWGLRPEITDAILESWRAGAVTAASAMVHMEDSDRAFELARREGLPLGLHLNLTTPFTAAAVPEQRRLRQQRAVEYFAAPRHRYALDPFAWRLLDRCVADQLEAFAESLGRAATHADGHQHLQTCPTVLSSRSLGALRTLRRAHGFVPDQRSSPKRAYRGLVNLVVEARFRSVCFVSIRDVHPELGGVGLGGVISRAQGSGVELMVHPAWADEQQVLLSDSWRELVDEMPTGSHADLS